MDYLHQLSLIIIIHVKYYCPEALTGSQRHITYGYQPVLQRLILVNCQRQTCPARASMAGAIQLRQTQATRRQVCLPEGLMVNGGVQVSDQARRSG